MTALEKFLAAPEFRERAAEVEFGGAKLAFVCRCLPAKAYRAAIDKIYGADGETELCRYILNLEDRTPLFADGEAMRAALPEAVIEDVLVKFIEINTGRKIEKNSVGAPA